MPTPTLTPSRAAALDAYRDKLLTGGVFATAAIGIKSRHGYQPPTSRRSWAHRAAVIARMAVESDALAQVAAKIGTTNLYGTDADANGAIYERAARAIACGYDDVIGRSGPEVGRRSDYHREFTLAEVASVAIYLEVATRPGSGTASGIGWALAAIADECGIDADAITARATA